MPRPAHLSVVALILAGSLLLGGCDVGATIAGLQTRQARVDPPALWVAEALSPSGRITRSMGVCADTPLREGFARANAEVNGEPCRAVGPAVNKPGLYALRCEALGQTFAVTISTSGDQRRDFRVRYALTSLDRQRGPFVQTLRYRLVGPCPEGWGIGDEAELAG